MRRWSHIAPVLVIACGVLLLGAAPAVAGAGDKLVVDSVTEPPDTQARGGKWRLTVTVSNEGNARSTSDRVRWFLSLGRRFSADDLQRRLTGAVTLPALNRNRQSTKRVTLGIPATIQDGVYYLVTCLGRTAQNTDNLNCRFSGQTMRIGGVVQAQAQSQSPGPPGPPGADRVQLIPRTTAAIGRAVGDSVRRPRTSRGRAGNRPATRGQRGAGFPDEGSDSTVQLAKVGPVTVLGLCRRTTNGDNQDPDEDPISDFEFDEDGDEAIIVFRLDEGAGTMSWRGPHGPRRNIPPGDDIGAPQSSEFPDDDGGGTGKHMALATARDPAPVVTDEVRGDGPTGGPEDDWETGFVSGSVLLATTGGTEFVLHGYAGIDTLGVGDNCVFGGGITVLRG
jgi:hypothetical protein